MSENTNLEAWPLSMSDDPQVRMGSGRLPVFETFLASDAAAVEAVQRLRYQVFAIEMGANLPSSQNGLDQDEFDPYCEHLMVCLPDTGEVVASTRILTQEKASLAGGYYSESEFDLGPVTQLPGRIMEVGRTCVRADYRSGSAIHALWIGLARFMTEHHYDYLIGCASIPYQPGDVVAEAVLNHLSIAHPAPRAYRVVPRRAVPFPTHHTASRNGMPPLLKAYLRLGAWICGEPCWDPNFSVADVFILLDRHQAPDRYQRHFLRRAN